MVAFALAMVAVPANAWAASEVRPVSLAFPRFDSGAAAAFQFNGTAAHEPASGALRLTPTTTYAAGSALYRRGVKLGEDRSFSTHFKIDMHSAPGNRADGMAFVLAPSPGSLGARGGGLGYANVPNSFAVEFDTFYNSGYNAGDKANYADPNNNHVGINIGGDMISRATMMPTFTMYGAPVYAWVDYDGTTVEVRVSRSASRPSAASITYDVDLSTVLGDVVYPGFSAGTGSLTTIHDVPSWYFNADSIDEGIDPTAGEFVAEPTQVLVSDASSGTVDPGGSVRLTARFTDATGAPVANWPASFSVAGGTIVAEAPVTDADGRVSALFTAPSTGGDYSIVVGGGSGPSTTYGVAVLAPSSQESSGTADPPEPSGDESATPPTSEEARGMINGDVEVSARLGIAIDGTDLHYGSPALGEADVAEVNDQRTIVTNLGDVRSELFVQGDGPARGERPDALWQMATRAGEDTFVWRFEHPLAGAVDILPDSASALGSLGHNDSLDFGSSIDMPTFSSSTGTYRWSATIWVTAPE